MQASRQTLVFFQVQQNIHLCVKCGADCCCHEIPTIEPASRSSRSAGPPHSPFDTKSCCFLGKTCPRRKTCRQRKRRLALVLRQNCLCVCVCVCGGDSGRENHCIYDQGKTLLGMFYPMHTGSKRVFDGPHKYVASNESRLNPIISKQTSWHPVKIGSAPHGLAKRCWHHKTGDSGPALAVPLDVCLRVSESPA